MTEFQKSEVQVAQQFSSGFAKAFVDFADGSKSAAQAFGEFAASMLEDVAEIIIKAEALALIMPMLGFKNVNGQWVPANSTVTSGSGGGGDGGGGIDWGGMISSVISAFGDGGMKFAANGIQSVSSATYLPKFNTIAGEAGREMLTVLARPTFRSIGGMDAVVGMAGNNRLAITNADDLQSRGGGAGGLIHIQIDHTPETQATIVQNSIKGAVTEVAKQMKRHSPISAAVKGLVA